MPTVLPADAVRRALLQLPATSSLSASSEPGGDVERLQSNDMFLKQTILADLEQAVRARCDASQCRAFDDSGGALDEIGQVLRTHDAEDVEPADPRLPATFDDSGLGMGIGEAAGD